LQLNGGLVLSARIGETESWSLATLNDANPDDAPGSYSVSINWGDSSTSTGTVSGEYGAFLITGSHSYSGAGTFTVTVTSTDGVRPSLDVI
jgi:hypothetical protein